MSDRIVVEVARRGRFFVGEPFFTPGVPTPLDKRGLDRVRPGELAVVAKGRGRARLQKSLGPADRIENVLEALLEHEGARTDFEPHDPPAEADEIGRASCRERVLRLV